MALWFLGLAAIFVATSSAVEVYDTTLFSVHSVQHLLLQIVAPVPLGFAAPITLALRPLSSQSIACCDYHRGMTMDGGECVTAAIAAGMAPAVALFRSLADETRLRIVQRLATGEARVVDLTGELGLAQSTVSKHLACLRDCGLVDYRTEGRQSFYALTRPELMDLLQAAEGVLAATGLAVALCPTDGAGADERAVVAG